MRARARTDLIDPAQFLRAPEETIGCAYGVAIGKGIICHFEKLYSSWNF